MALKSSYNPTAACARRNCTPTTGCHRRTASGRKILRHLLEGDAYYFGRQHLEDERHKYHKLEENALALTNEKHAAYMTYAAIDTDGGAGRAWAEYQQARWSMYAYSGARQALQHLIDECDMKVIPDNLRLEI